MYLCRGSWARVAHRVEAVPGRRRAGGSCFHLKAMKLGDQEEARSRM